MMRISRFGRSRGVQPIVPNIFKEVQARGGARRRGAAGHGPTGRSGARADGAQRPRPQKTRPGTAALAVPGRAKTRAREYWEDYSLSPAVIWVAESMPSELAAASGHTQLVKSGWS